MHKITDKKGYLETILKIVCRKNFVLILSKFELKGNA